MAGLMVCCSASDGVGGSSAPLCPPGCAPRVRRPHCAGVVGRCVLAALDDLHYRHSAARRPSRDGLSPSSEAPEALLRSSRFPLHDLRPHKHLDDTTSESSYDSASDYHLYEEILYEATASPRPPEAIPPPLPARPPHLFRSVLVQHPQEPQQTQQPQQPQTQTQPRLQQPLPPQRRHPPEVQTTTQQPQHKQTVPHVQTLAKPTDSPQTSPPAQPQSSPQPHQCRTKPTPPPKPPKPQRAVQSSPEGKPVTPLKHPLPPPTTSLTNTTTNLTTPSPKVGSQTAGGAPQPQPPQQQQQQQQDQQQQQQQGDGSVPLKPTINKPKQRSNLYSIFRDRDHRRCLSASLQQEYQKDFQQEFLSDPNPAGTAVATTTTTTTTTAATSCASLAGAEDDYGFKVVPHVV